MFLAAPSINLDRITTFPPLPAVKNLVVFAGEDDQQAVDVASKAIPQVLHPETT